MAIMLLCTTPLPTFVDKIKPNSVESLMNQYHFNVELVMKWPW